MNVSDEPLLCLECGRPLRHCRCLVGAVEGFDDSEDEED